MVHGTFSDGTMDTLIFMFSMLTYGPGPGFTGLPVATPEVTADNETYSWTGGGFYHWNYSNYLVFMPLGENIKPRVLLPIACNYPDHGLNWTAARIFMDSDPHTNCTLDGNFLVISISILFDVDPYLGEMSQELLIKWDTTTGWLNYAKISVEYSKEDIQVALEIKEAAGGGIPGFGLVWAFGIVALIGTITLFLKKKQI